MKHLFLATLIVVLSVGNSHAQISTILTRLTAQRALTNTNITTKTGAGSITPRNVGYSDDSIMAIMYSLAGLTGAAGDLDAVLTLGNTSDLDVVIDKNGLEGEFKTKHMYNGCQVIHDPSGGGSEYPVTFMGRVGGNNVLYLRDAFGYFGYMGAGSLTADRKVLLPDEGDGVGLDATLVLHTTANPITVTSGSNTGYYDADSVKLSDASGNESYVLPYWMAVWNTAGTQKDVMVMDNNSLSYGFTNSVGTVSHTATLFFNRSSFTGTTNDSLWYPSARNDTLAVKGDITAMGNFATADLTFTGDRYHNVKRYNVDIDSVNKWNITDTSGKILLSLDDTTASLPMIHATSTPSANKIGLNASGSLRVIIEQTSGVNRLTAIAPNASLIVDSAIKAVGINHIAGTTTAPTIAAGAGAGTSPTVSVGSGSTDLSGYLNITTGTTCTALATVATVTFNIAYATAPKCIILQPANAVTAALLVAKVVHVPQSTISTTTFELLAGATALTDATAYQWYYFVVQ